MINLEELEEFVDMSNATHNDIVNQFSKKSKKELDEIYLQACKQTDSFWKPAIEDEDLKYTMYEYITKSKDLVGIVVSGDEFNVFVSKSCYIGCCGHFINDTNFKLEELTEEFLNQLD